MISFSQERVFSQATEDKLKEIVRRYPSSKSAVMPALYLAQAECGWLTDEAFRWVSARLSLPIAHVVEVASFYTMFYKQPVGKYHIQICRTLSCMLCGARKLLEHCKSRFGISSHEVSKDGMWSFEEVECLGSCGTGPLVQINGLFFENLNLEKFEALLTRIEKEQPEIQFCPLRDEIQPGLSDLPRSQILQA